MADGGMIEFEDLSKSEEKKEFDVEAARQLEIDMAKALYDREDVKKAGQEALSKVSNLLIRYNRLKDAQSKREADTELASQEATILYNKTMTELQKEKEKVVRISDDEQKGKALSAIAEKEKAAKDAYDEAVLENAKKVQKDYEEGLNVNIDSDRAGGILASLMLGGTAIGSEGYTLSTGDAGDLMKASAYISEVTGEEGTFLSQMSLLDNAVNTNGIDLVNQEGEYGEWGLKRSHIEDDYIGSSATGAKYSLGDILRNITAEDVSQMDFFSGSQTKVDIAALEEERKYGGIDESIGKTKDRKTIKQAAEERGFSKEAIARMKGKKGGVNDHLNKKEKAEIIAGAQTLTPVKGFFSSVFGDKPDYMREKKGVARRSALREERKAWQERMHILAEAKEKPVISFGENENDTAENVFSKFENTNRPDTKVKKETSNKNTSKEGDKLKDKEKQALESVSNQEDKSARNMIAAYRLLGATPQELYMFRLALIAYMVPTGKKTLSEILKESEEAGYKGNEDLSSPEQMYATFQEAPVVDGIYVNKFQKKEKVYNNEKEQLKKMNTASREKMMQALSAQEKNEKIKAESEIAEKQSQSLTGRRLGSLSRFMYAKNKNEGRVSKWTNGVTNTITENEISEENDEEFVGLTEEEMKKQIRQNELDNPNAKWNSPKDAIITEELEEAEELEDMEEQEEEQPVEDTPLGKALLQHFEIVGRFLPEEELLQTFTEVFENEQEREQFSNVLQSQELSMLRSNILNVSNYNNEIRTVIRRLKEREA